MSVRIPRLIWLVLAVALLVAALSSCSEDRAEVRGIVLVSVEALRADVLALYGGDVALPQLERLAAQGTLYEDAATMAPLARPAAATLLTGVAPDRSGVRDDVNDVLPEDIPTLAGLLAPRGWVTAALVGTPFCSWASGLDRGFELFDGAEDVLFGSPRYFPKPVPAATVAERFGQWIETVDPGRPFFAWVHLADLHGIAVREPTGEESRARYGEALPLLDSALGEIVAALEAKQRFADTAIVVVGTHGTLFGEDGARGAPYWLRRETLAVPLVVKPATASGAEQGGTRSPTPVWLPDVPRTLAAWAGVTLDPRAEGLVLGSADAEAAARVRHAWTWAPEDEVGWPTLTAVHREGRWTSFGWDDLEEGADASPAAATARQRPARPRERELDAERRLAIEQAGLVEAWVDRPTPEPEAAERNAFLTELQELRHPPRRSMLPRVQWTRAKQLLQEREGNLAVLEHSFSLVVMGHAAEAAAELRDRALPRYPLRPAVMHWSGHAYWLAGDTANAELLIESALSMVGTDPDMVYDLACTRALQGDADAALGWLDRAIAAGFRKWEHIEQDPDLVSLRNDPRYAELMRSHGR